MKHIFTSQERFALSFLIGITLLGMGLLTLQRTATQERPTPFQLIAINRATVQELTALPGIGKVTAQRIVADRNDNGRFLTLSDLTRVKGISKKSLKRFRYFVRFD